MVNPISSDLRPYGGLAVRVDISMRHRFPIAWMFVEGNAIGLTCSHDPWHALSIMSDVEQEQGKLLIEKRSVSIDIDHMHGNLSAMMSAIEAAGRAMHQQSPGSFIIAASGKLAINPKDTGDVLRDWPSSREIVESVRELKALEERMAELENKEKELFRS